MIRLVTIDDEPLALKLLELYSSKIEDVVLTASCQSAEEAAEVLSKGQVDCIFTDINMPGTSGLDFVRNLDSPPLVVFTTAYSEYAVEGFRVNAVDYLVKPIGFEDFSQAIERVRRLLALQNNHVPAAVEDSVFFFKVGHQRRRVTASEISYVESLGAYLKVYCGDEAPFVVLGNFKSIEDADPRRFVRIHKSFMVNRDNVRQAGKTSVTLNNGATLPVGGSHRDEISKIFG